MSALEQEIIEKFHRLQHSAKQRLLTLMQQEVASEVEQPDPSIFDYVTWFREMEDLRREIHTNSAIQGSVTDVVGMLRDIRDGEDE